MDKENIEIGGKYNLPKRAVVNDKHESVDEICECIKIEDKGVWFKPVTTPEAEPFFVKNYHLFWVEKA